MQFDPYVAQAQNDDVSPLQKIEGIVSPPLEYAILSVCRSEQDHSGGSDGYANYARVGWSSPRESNDPG